MEMQSESDPQGHASGWIENLFDRNAARLILYGRALGLSHGESEDVLQETFRGLMGLPECPEKPLHYCLRAFRNRAFNYRRSLWRRVLREFESIRWFERSESESELERQAMGGLADLPIEQREVIVLKIWHRNTFEEIGELLGISPNTAAGRYRYGLRRLKSRLSQPSLTYELDESTGGSFAFLEAPRSIPGS